MLVYRIIGNTNQDSKNKYENDESGDSEMHFEDEDERKRFEEDQKLAEQMQKELNEKSSYSQNRIGSYFKEDNNDNSPKSLIRKGDQDQPDDEIGIYSNILISFE